MVLPCHAWDISLLYFKLRKIAMKNTIQLEISVEISTVVKSTNLFRRSLLSDHCIQEIVHVLRQSNEQNTHYMTSLLKHKVSL